MRKHSYRLDDGSSPIEVGDVSSRAYIAGKIVSSHQPVQDKIVPNGGVDPSASNVSITSTSRVIYPGKLEAHPDLLE